MPVVPRLAAPLATVLTVLAIGSGCGLGPPERQFQSLGDFERTVPARQAGRSEAPRFLPPPGVRLASRVEVRRDDDEWPTYEMVVTAAVRGDAPVRARVEPVAEDAVLIDDEGGRFRCTRLRIPDVKDEKDPGRRTWTLIFDLPASYRPSKMLTLTVHWSVVIDGQPFPLTSRFRA